MYLVKTGHPNNWKFESRYQTEDEYWVQYSLLVCLQHAAINHALLLSRAESILL